MLLHRGHGSILSGFFRVFSSEPLVSLCSPFFEAFIDEVSLSAEGVVGFSLMLDDVGFFESSEIRCEVPSSCLFVVNSLPKGS